MRGGEEGKGGVESACGAGFGGGEEHEGDGGRGKEAVVG